MSELQGAVALAQIRKTDVMLAGYRRAHRRIKEAIEPVPGLTFRRVPDESGDTGICLILFLKDAETTRKAMQAMQAEGVPAGGIYDQKVRDWHIYAYWEHILEKKHVAADGLPWSAVPAEELPALCKRHVPAHPRPVEPGDHDRHQLALQRRGLRQHRPGHQQGAWRDVRNAREWQDDIGRGDSSW